MAGTADIDIVGDCSSLSAGAPSTPRSDRECLALARVYLARSRQRGAEGNHDQALELAQAALACLENNSAASVLDRIEINRAAALAAWYGVSPLAARPYYAAAAALLQPGPVAPAVEAEVLNDLALCEQKLNELETARALYERAFGCARQARRAKLSREIARRLSTLAIDTGQFAVAGHHLWAARPPSRSPVLERLRWHHAMAMWAELDLQLDLAESHFDRCLELFEQAPETTMSSMGCVPNAGLLKFGRNKLAEASLLLEKAFALDRKGAPVEFRLALYGLQAKLTARRSGVASGLDVLRAGIAHFGRPEHAAPHRAAALVLLGAEMLADAHQDDAVTRWIGDWLCLSVDTLPRPLEGHEIVLALLWATLLPDPGKGAVIAGIVATGLAACAQLEEENLEALTLILMARRARAAGQREHSILLAKLAANLLLERATMVGVDDIVAATVLKVRHHALAQLRAELIGVARIVEARQVLEGMRLRGSFELAHGRTHAAPLILTLTDSEAEWARRYTTLRDHGRDLAQRHADWTRSAAERDAAAVSFAAVEADLVAMADQVVQPGRSALAVSLAARWASAVTPTGQAVLRFHQSEHDAIVELSFEGHTQHVPIDLGPVDMARLVAAFSDAIFDQGAIEGPGRALYMALLAPAEGILVRASGLELVVDGALAQLPFAALHDGHSYLIERLPLSYRSGVGDHALPAWQQPDRIAVFGSTLGTSDGRLSPLPFVREEVASIRAIFDEAAHDFSGARFSRRRLAAALRDGTDIVHIASHFLLSPGSTERSCLLLGDGRLMAAAELARPDMPWDQVQLLFLSACEAGASGPGGETMAVMFHRLGVARLIASLWPVLDDATARLVAVFYEGLAQGQEPAAALRHAQTGMIAAARHSRRHDHASLRDWAAFKLFVPGR
jgi:CHAT domain-containing protein/tetratricopeptide (TPR) repeat protein